MAAKKQEQQKMLTVTLVKSTAGRLEKQQRTVEALGLKKIGQSATLPDNAATRGMIRVVSHLVEVNE